MNMISIIFFGYNEENNIRKSISDICQNLPNKKFEIIIINDGSKDDTQNEIEKINTKELKVIKINKHINEGIAKAVYDGLKKAEGDLVTWLPSDGAYNVKSLCEFYNTCSSTETDLSIGYRNNKKKRNFFRYFLSEFLTIILNLIFFKKVKDYNGVISVKKNLLDKIKLPNHPSFQWVIIMQLLKQKVKYSQIPIDMKIPEPGNGSSSMNIKTYLSYFFSLIKLIQIIFFNKND